MGHPFTPGPWTIEGAHPWKVKCQTQVPDILGDVATVRYLPNARLIAAAPDLLTSLVECVRMLEAVRYTAGLGKHQMERLEKAKAAIAEAEGRSDA